jgi:multidrug resistance efflux pump
LNAKRLVPLVLIAAAAGSYWLHRPVDSDLVLTGVVTTEDIIISAQISGLVDSLAVGPGDPVRRGQLLAVVAPAELEADESYFLHSAEASSAQVSAAEADVAAAEAAVVQAEATLAQARQTLDRTASVVASGGLNQQMLDQAATAAEVAQAATDAARQRVTASRSALAAVRQQSAAAEAQARKAGVRLTYTEIRSPVDGIVDVRATRLGEVVGPGQPLLTLVDPDDFWVRADVEESYIDLIRAGDALTVRLPSGRERPGTVFYRGADADFATQRDVSRTKRDIKTFEIRLRVDNSTRDLALGMTAYVVLPGAKVRP